MAVSDPCTGTAYRRYADSMPLRQASNTSISADAVCSVDRPRPFSDDATQGSSMAYSPDGEALHRPSATRGQVVYAERLEALYQEAAVYLLEGMHNDKLDSHPSDPKALKAYHFAHSTLFHLIDFVAGLLLMLLALCERPSITDVNWPVRAYVSVELLLLALLAGNLVLRLRWLKWQNWRRNPRIIVKGVVVVFMLVDAFVVMGLNHEHIRILRALRPFFLFDSYYFKGVRRTARQILQATPAVLDMVVLILFIMVTFAAFASFVVSKGDDDPYLDTFANCFYNLFILMTTANFPDVMMPSYYEHPVSAIFFILYICVMVFVLLNLLLAVVFSSFQALEKRKFRKLLVHKRKVIMLMYDLVTNAASEDGISFPHFAGIMKYFKPRMSLLDVQCVFLHLSGGYMGKLSRAQLYTLYTATSLKWSQLDSSLKEVRWFSSFPPVPFRVFKALASFVHSKIFDALSYLILLATFVLMLFVVINDDLEDDTFTEVVVVLFGLTCCDSLLKVLANGPRRFAKIAWNLYDLLLIVLVIVGLAFSLTKLQFVIFLRSFRLLRLFQLRKRYQDIMTTVVSLVPQMGNVVLVLLLLYYFFAIIGMEVMGERVYPGCCRNPKLMVEQYYAAGNFSNETSYYYLNSFNNLFRSYVTLFELMVINNWWVTMSGFVSETSEWVRIFFIFYYFLSLVVLNILVSFVLDAFVFHLALSPGSEGMEDIHTSSRGSKYYQVVKVKIGYDELMKDLSVSDIFTCPAEGFLLFEGRRRFTREDFSSQMHNDEVQVWLDALEREYDNAQSAFAVGQETPGSLGPDLRRNLGRVRHYIKDMVQISRHDSSTTTSLPYRTINLSDDGTGQPVP